MNPPDKPSLLDQLEVLAEQEAQNSAHYELTLYIAGLTPRSQEAIRNVEQVCRQNLAGRYTLHIIDIYQQPDLALEDQVIAVPALIKRLPVPLRMILGSMAEKDKLLLGLGLKPLDKHED